MSDYEDYWTEREKDEEGEEVAEKEVVMETFYHNGEDVRVLIMDDVITFEYENGTTRTVPIDRVRFCPECMRNRIFPFTLTDEICQRHRSPYLKFSLSDYENFKIISKMEGGLIVPH